MQGSCTRPKIYYFDNKIFIPEVHYVIHIYHTTYLRYCPAVEQLLTLVFDAIIFLITISHTWANFRQAKSVGMKATLTQLLLRDGTSMLNLGEYNTDDYVQDLSTLRERSDSDLFLKCL